MREKLASPNVNPKILMKVNPLFLLKKRRELMKFLLIIVGKVKRVSLFTLGMIIQNHSSSFSLNGAIIEALDSCIKVY